MIDNFEITDKDRSKYRGDSDSYFPIGFSSSLVFSSPLKADDDYTGVVYGSNFFVSQNEISIEDDMLFYDQRSTKFINFNRREEVSYSTKHMREVKDGEIKTWPEVLYHFSF